MTELAGKTALITGGSSGIGEAVARRFAAAGARVAIAATDEAKLQRVASDIRGAGGECLVRAANLADPDAVAATFASIRGSYGDPEVVVNAAGRGRWQFAYETDPAEAIAMVGAPYLAAFFVTREALPAMLERGCGHIVNLTSVAAFMTWPGATGYTAMRWAIRGLHEALRADLAGTAIVPTLATFAKVSSDYWTHNPGSEARVPAAQSSIPTLTPDEAAAAIVEGVADEREHVVAPSSLRRLLWLNRWFPSLVERRLHVPASGGSVPPLRRGRA